MDYQERKVCPGASSLCSAFSMQLQKNIQVLQITEMLYFPYRNSFPSMNFEAEILTTPHDNSGIWEKKRKKEIKVKCPLRLLQTCFNSFGVKDC